MAIITTMDTIADGETPVLDAVSSWIQRGNELRERLVRQRGAAVAELQRIDAALASIGHAPGSIGESIQAITASSGTQAIPAQLASVKNQSITEIVRTVVESNHAGISAKRVVEIAHAMKIKIKPVDAYAALYRMVKRGELTSKGSRGDRTYHAADGAMRRTSSTA